MLYLTGKELHEDDQILRKGLHLVRHMQFYGKELGARHGMKISLEESPAESAARRLAKMDLRQFPVAEHVVRGNIESDEVYYTNSIHMRADADMDLLTRITRQSKFHRAIESGAIIHAFVGEERPPAASIMNLLEKTFHRTQAAQLTISPEFTICNDCHQQTGGIRESCGYCHSTDVYGMTRVVGYFSRVHNWNKSKIAELRDRQKGNYSVSMA
jgi:ribonucleoside-triphosphate reductase